MDSDLTKLLMEKLQSPQIQSVATPTFNDQMSSLVEQFEKKKVGDRLEQAFMQVMDRAGERQSILHEDSFEGSSQSLKGLTKKPMLMKGFGASIAGSVGGLISGFLPLNFGIQGIPQILAGLLISKVGKGKTSDIAEGMTITGIGLAISGLLGGSINSVIGGLGGRSTSSPSATAGVLF